MNAQSGCWLAATGPQFNVLATNTMNDGGAFNACPAIGDGQLLIRSDRFLYCVGAK